MKRREEIEFEKMIRTFSGFSNNGLISLLKIAELNPSQNALKIKALKALIK